MDGLFDKLEILETLYKESKLDDKAARQCRSYIAKNINYFYKEASVEQFVKIIDYYNSFFKSGESNIIDILKSKNIPYVLANYRYNNEISKTLIENDAYDAYKESNFVEALEYIKLLSQKYTLELKMYILKGHILRDLGSYNSAIDSYRSAKELKSLDFTANSMILYTYLLKYKKEWTIFILLIIILIVSQFILFNKGIIDGKLDDFSLNVNEGTYIIEDDKTIVIPLGSKVNVDIDYRVIPSYSQEGEVSYRIDDDSIAKLENNVISGISEGTTTLEIIRNNKVVYTYNIIVAKSKVEHIEINTDKEIRNVGDKAKLEADVIRNYDFNEENKVKYESTNKKVLVVDEEGNVEVVGVGKASIVATCDGYSEEEEFIISLVIEDIEVEDDVEVEVGSIHQLKVNVVSNSGNVPTSQVIFSLEEDELEEDKIISMDRYGRIKGIKAGIQIVKARYGQLEKSILVTVVPKKMKNVQVENLKVTSQINEEYLDINLVWDPIEIEGFYEYDIYTKLNSEDGFSKVGTTSKENTSYDLKVDIKDLLGKNNVDIYVVARNSDGQSKASKTMRIDFIVQDKEEDKDEDENENENKNEDY